MKTYVAIGHFKDNKNTTVVALTQNSLKDFRMDLLGNEFVAYIATTAEHMKKITDFARNDEIFTLFKAVERLTSNYRKWGEITDYIDQCYDIIERRIANA